MLQDPTAGGLKICKGGFANEICYWPWVLKEWVQPKSYGLFVENEKKTIERKIPP